MKALPWIATFLSGMAAVIVLEILKLEALLEPLRGILGFFLPNE